jgi:hypothetical protein
MGEAGLAYFDMLQDAILFHFLALHGLRPCSAPIPALDQAMSGLGLKSILVRNLAAENNMNIFAKRLTVYRKNLILQDIQLT